MSAILFIQMMLQNKLFSSNIQYVKTPELVSEITKLEEPLSAPKPVLNEVLAKSTLPKNNKSNEDTSVMPEVPFYSQFNDISSSVWQKKGCGITSLAMIINYYNPNVVSVNDLLSSGISSKAYLDGAGWIHQGLINLSKNYYLNGSTYDLSKLTNDLAFKKFKSILSDGPVIVSVHYKFDPKSTIPHLVVIDGIDEDNVIHYNDPAANGGDKKISVDKFLNGWKKRFIVIRPNSESKIAQS